MTSIPPFPAALIFDMDGVLVDSNPFHLQKWIGFLSERGIAFERDELPRLIFGQRNDTVLRHFLGAHLTQDESRTFAAELEARFRSVFQSHAQPLPGLVALIGEGRAANIPMGVASSAMARNVNFVVDALGFRPYFKCLVTGDDVPRSKPHPEIYLEAARRLGIDPAACVAFEDSFVGIEAAKRAGMRCVGIASTFPLGELCRETQADLIVQGFEDLSLERLGSLFVAAHHS